MKVPSVPLRVLSVLVLVLWGVPVSAAAQEAVDFSKAPAEGLKYKVVSKTHSEGTASQTRGEQTSELKMTGDRESTFVDTIVAVKEGKIVKLEREYEDVSSKMVMESDRSEAPREREQDSPLAWKHFRVEWNEDGEATVQVKSDDAWGNAEEALKRGLRPKRLRRPLFPLPAGKKTVGESWELSDEDVKVLARYYSGLEGFGPGLGLYAFGFLSFATVIPAVFETAILLKNIHVFDSLKLEHRHRITKKLLHSLMISGVVMLGLTLIFPGIFYPLIWIAFFLILDPINYLHGRPKR